jgi:hypothetical protein
VGSETIRTDDGAMLAISRADQGDIKLQLGCEETRGGRVHEIGDADLRPGQALRLIGALSAALGQPAPEADPRLKLMADALRLIAAVYWDEELGWLGDLEEEDEKYIGASDWHCGDLHDRKLLGSSGLPSGEYETYLTAEGDRHFKEALVAAIRITQPEMFANPAPQPEQEKDADDLCAKCQHERFHHDDGQEMGADGDCKVRGCTCGQFVAEPEQEKEPGGDGAEVDRG